MANTKITNPELFNLGDSTSATQLPVMTTTQRIAMNAPPTFNIDYLVVAGGGGGGPGYQAGGGGAGGMRTSFGTGNINGGLTAVENSLTLATGTSYTVQVGAAGAAGVGSFPSANRGGTGGDSGINGTGIAPITSQGGGGGASYNNAGQGGLNLQGSPGGSGGGSAPNGGQTATGGVRVTNPIQGFDGGDSLSYATPYYGAGGGGAGGAGGVSNGANTGLGGLGLESAITVASGTGPFYAGGGGGGSYYSTGGAPGVGGSGIGGNGGTTSPSLNAAGAGATNTGSGGGGGSNNGNVGGAGGSGIVILRYPTADVASYAATGITPTETTVGTDTILSFTTVGTGTITFTSSTPTGTISTGEMIFNSDTDKVEYFDGTKWYGITYEAPYSTAGIKDVFGDGSCLSLYQLDNNPNSTPTNNPGNGVWAGTAVYGAGKFGNAAVFNGSKRINLNFSMGSLPSPGYNASLSAWFKTTSTSSGFIISYRDPVYFSLFLLNNGDVQSTFYASSVTGTNAAVNDGNWHNIIATNNGSSIVIYIDGVVKGTAAGSTNIGFNAGFNAIGGRANVGASYINGSVDQVRFFNRVLTGAEITSLQTET
jgi:hypothetical protein